MSHHPHRALPTLLATTSTSPEATWVRPKAPPYGVAGMQTGSPAQSPSWTPPLTVVVTPERLVLGDVGVQVAELPQVPDPVAEGADGQILGREGLDVFHLAGA